MSDVEEVKKREGEMSGKKGMEGNKGRGKVYFVSIN